MLTSFVLPILKRVGAGEGIGGDHGGTNNRGAVGVEAGGDTEQGGVRGIGRGGHSAVGMVLEWLRYPRGGARTPRARGTGVWDNNPCRGGDGSLGSQY
ncbi:hypothetical protein Tco_0839468 [Tanacetum coccineum]|uniref:Uncharacterized protein n=1 Tax=Tanacetum coccineum TaxID=301880 RepID=A0ABQ5ART6_9ASTR